MATKLAALEVPFADFVSQCSARCTSSFSLTPLSSRVAFFSFSLSLSLYVWLHVFVVEQLCFRGTRGCVRACVFCFALVFFLIEYSLRNGTRHWKGEASWSSILVSLLLLLSFISFLVLLYFSLFRFP